jgi:hypothetical protein
VKPINQEDTMRYTLLICTEEKLFESMTEQEGNEMMAAYGAFSEEMEKRGVLEGGARLYPTPSATSVRVRDGEVITSDGPFAETKEQVGGYFVVNCKDIDEAIEIASKIPGAAHGVVEVRPIWEM